MNKDEAKQEVVDEKNNENQVKSDPELEKYIEIGKQCKADLDEYYSTISTFKVSTNSDTEYKFQNETFKINTLVSYSSQTKQKSDPMIWYTETICPGDPRFVYETWAFSKYRLKWDSFISSSQKIMLDAKNENVFIINTDTKPAAGGLISAREFVDLLNIFQTNDDDGKVKSVQVASKSITRNDFPERKGFVRGDVVLSGVLFERLTQDEIKNKYKLPKLMINDEKNNEKCEVEWSRIKYIVQSNIKGWIPSSVINTAMSSTNSGMMRDLRAYIMTERLAL